MAEPVTIVVDGREVPAEKGEMVIAAAERAGVYIPRFCYHPRMRPVGMCRMCLVHIKGPRGYSLQPACFVPVAEGQEIVTDSAPVKKAQDGVLEFLLVNHPLDCPVCDKGGECPLQDQTLAFGPGETRFVEEKRHWAKPIPLSELVYLDRERCIQCDRCTRFADEVAGDALIEFTGRGDHTEIATFPDAPFSSYFSGNTVQICPVGALLARPYRFMARPWDLEQVESTCVACSVGCRTAVQSSANALTRYLGVDSDPVNHGWLCDMGRFSFEAVNSDQRVTSPMVRKGDELVAASWGEALEAAASGLQQARTVHGPGALAVLGGARLANEDAYAWARLAKGVLGTDNVDAQLGDGLPAELILGLPRATIDQTCSAPAVILLAPDIKEELPVLYLRLRGAAVDAQVPMIELSTRRSGLSRYCRNILAYRPGEAAILARALVVAADPIGEVAGVPAVAVVEARRLLAEGAVLVLGRPSLAESADSIAEAAATLAGGIAGLRVLPALRRSNVMGALDMGLAPGILPGRVSLDEGRAWFASAWGGVPEARGLDAAGILAAAAGGRVQGLVLLGADPVADFPDAQVAREALAGAGFVVAVDTFLTESSRQADVVLPAAAYAERPGTTTNLEGRITRLGQKIVPGGVAWPDWMIATELAARLGADPEFTDVDGIWDEIEAVAPSHAGITRATLADRRHRDGVVAPLPPMAPLAPMANSAELAPESDAGARHLAPSSEVEAPAQGGRPPLLRYVPAAPAAAAAAAGAVPALDSYSLRLVSGRTLYGGGTGVQRSPSLAGLAPSPAVGAHPGDLAGLGLAQGGRLRIRSPRGSVEVGAVADPGVRRGTLWFPFNAVGGGPGAGDLIDASAPVNDVRLETL